MLRRNFTRGFPFRRFCRALSILATFLGGASVASSAVLLTSYTFQNNAPPQIYYASETMPAVYKLRLKVLGVSGYPDGLHAVEGYGNNLAPLTLLPAPGTYSAQLYWLKYDANGQNMVVGPANNVTLNILAADTTAPSTPANLASSNLHPRSLTLTWNAATDNIAVTGYEVFRGSTSLGLYTTTSASVTGLTESTAYAFTVKARDAAGNSSAASTTLNVTTPGDTTAPSVPTGLAASNVLSKSATLTWTASTDNYAVTGYHISAGGAPLADVVGTSVTLKNLSPGTTHPFVVRARDAVGNWSANTSVLNVTTSNDTTPPSIPTNLVVTEVTGNSVRLTWTAATDAVGVTGYELFKNGESGGVVSGVTTVLTGLKPGTLYAFTVRAKDAADNWSAQSGSKWAKTWLQLLKASDTISSHEEWDEWSESYNWVTDQIWHGFTTPGAGQVRAYVVTAGSLHGELWLGYSPDAAATGSFPLAGTTTATSAQSGSVMVTANTDPIPYQVFVDFKATNVAPVASISATPIVGRAPLQVILSGTGSSDKDGMISTYAWDVDNNGSTEATSATFIHIYPNTGTTAATFTAKLTVTDLDAATTTATQAITVYPASSFGVEVQDGATNVPYQQSGSTVNLTANTAPAGMQFNGWVVVSGSGTFANAANASTTLTVGSADTVVKATYSYPSGSGSSPDTVAPAAPTNLAISDVTASYVTLTWTAATDNVGVTNYEVFRGGVSVAVIGAVTTWTNTGLTGQTIYHYSVRARDGAGNWGPQSGLASIRTWQRIENRSDTVHFDYTYDEVWGWDWRHSDNGHSFYAPSNGTAKIHFLSRGPGTNAYWNYPANTGTVYESETTDYNVSGGPDYSSPYHLVTDFRPYGQPVSVDFQPAPATIRGGMTVTLDAGRSFDPMGALTAYAWDFDNNGTTDATTRVATTSYVNTGSSPVTYTAKLTVTGPSGTGNVTRTITICPTNWFGISVESGTTSAAQQITGGTVTLTAGTPPSGTVFASWILVSGTGTFTNAGSASTAFTIGSSDAVVRATYTADVTAPTAPTALAYAERTAKTVTLIWNASIDNLGVTGYLVYRGGTLIGSTADLVFADSGLTASTAYSYTVKASDAAGNLSAASTALSVTTTADFTADTDQDGIPNAVETALSTNGSAAATADTTNQTQLNIHRPTK